jgi:predicted HNH restriction endonuclease
MLQIAAAISHDWSAFVPDYESVTEAELIETSRVYLEGAITHISSSVRSRCQSLRMRVAELYRGPDGFLCCSICGWKKPTDGRFSGDIVEMHHHNKPISSLPAEGQHLTLEQAIDVMIPVGPTCHRLLHARRDGKTFTAAELRKILFPDSGKR